MYTQQMADENKAMLKRAKEIWKVSQSYGLVMSLMSSEFYAIDKRRIRRWVNKAGRELESEAICAN